MNLTQKEVGIQVLKTTVTNIKNWETNRRQVSLRFRRQMHEFLGVCPCDVSLPIGGRLKERREYAGITRKELAEKFNVDEHTVSAWEERNQPPTPANVEKYSDF